MNVRTLVAALAGTVVNFALGFLIYGLLLDPYFKAHMIQYPGLMIDPPNFVPLILSNFVWCWLFAFIFDSWASIRSFAGGMKGGAIILFALVLGINLQFMAFMHMWKDGPYIPMLLDVLGGTVMGAITGGVIGFVLGKMYKE